MDAMLVFDNLTQQIAVPAAMGKPRHDQLTGTPYEQLAELAGRVCYGSLGTGRSTGAFFEHILEAGHYSIFEHCNLTTIYPCDTRGLHNRPGVYVENKHVTFNPRVVLDWDLHDSYFSGDREILKEAVSSCMPLVFGLGAERSRIEPETENQIWATFHITCTRACAQELTRHGDFTAISMRSTRYVDERDCKLPGSGAYQSIVRREYTETKNRLLLPLGLETQLIFSASMKQWNRIFKARISKYADVEINDLCKKIRDILLEHEQLRYFVSGWAGYELC